MAPRAGGVSQPHPFSFLWVVLWGGRGRGGHPCSHTAVRLARSGPQFLQTRDERLATCGSLVLWASTVSDLRGNGGRGSAGKMTGLASGLRDPLVPLLPFSLFCPAFPYSVRLVGSLRIGQQVIHFTPEAQARRGPLGAVSFAGLLPAQSPLTHSDKIVPDSASLWPLVLGPHSVTVFEAVAHTPTAPLFSVLTTNILDQLVQRASHAPALGLRPCCS